MVASARRLKRVRAWYGAFEWPVSAGDAGQFGFRWKVLRKNLAEGATKSCSLVYRYVRNSTSNLASFFLAEKVGLERERGILSIPPYR